MPPVVIVGAGPTGLVLAIELARRGVAFRLIDRRTDSLGWDRAIFIKSRSLEILAGMSLADQFTDQGQMVTGFALYSGAAQVASFDLANLDSPYPIFFPFQKTRPSASSATRCGNWDMRSSWESSSWGSNSTHGSSGSDSVPKGAAIRF